MGELCEDRLRGRNSGASELTIRRRPQGPALRALEIYTSLNAFRGVRTNGDGARACLAWTTQLGNMSDPNPPCPHHPIFEHHVAPRPHHRTRVPPCLLTTPPTSTYRDNTTREGDFRSRSERFSLSIVAPHYSLTVEWFWSNIYPYPQEAGYRQGDQRACLPGTRETALEVIES